MLLPKKVLLSITVSIFSLSASVLLAAPIVEGNTIGWPDDGWYQVQQADNYSTVCEGTRFCTVEPGEYIVINHTTGERFEQVRVESEGAENEGPDDVLTITVLGNVIYWPDDGWYQVQRAGDYSTVCEGGQSCSVEPGSYTVINHSLGVRYEDIVVDGSGSNNSEVAIEGTVIQWTGDGWFQVQNATDFSTVCEGEVNSCETGTGEFQLINLSTGQRWENLLVGAPEVPDSGSADDGPVLTLTGVVYTDAEIELFWERLPELSGVTAYRIWRDGVELDTRDALSFYENGLAPGTTYLYEVAPVSNGSEIGPRVAIELSTPALVSVINNDNAASIIQYLASVINEEHIQPYSQLIGTITDYSQTDTTDSANDGFEYIDSQFFPPDSSPMYEEHYYRCVANDGNLSVGRSLSLQQYGGEVEFERCRSNLVDNQTVQGVASYDWTLIRLVFNPGSLRGISFEELVFEDSQANTQSLSANLSIRSGSQSSRTWTGASEDVIANSYNAQAFGGATTIAIDELFRNSGATTESGAPPWSRTLRASFTTQSPQTGNKSIVVSTLEEFVTSQHDSCFETGVLTATGTDGSWLRIDAGNGDNDTFELSVHQDGNTTTQTIQWTSANVLMQLAGADSTAPGTSSGACAGLYVPVL